MRKGVDRHRTVQFAIDPIEQIEVERGGDTVFVVVRGNQRRLVLDPVHPDEQHRAFAQRGAHGAQQIDRHQRDHIADRRSGKEAQLGRIRDGLGQGERTHEVRLERQHQQVGKGRRQHPRRFTQEIARYINRHVGGGRRTAQQHRRFGRRPRPELHHRTAPPGNFGNLRAYALQDRGFGTGRVIFAQTRDILEQFRAASVVEPARRNRPRTPFQPGEHVGAELRIGQRLLAVLDFRLQHQMSLASRTPVNCQRW